MTATKLYGRHATLHLYDLPDRVTLRYGGLTYVTGRVEAFIEGPHGYIILRDEHGTTRRIDLYRIDFVIPTN